MLRHPIRRLNLQKMKPMKSLRKQAMKLTKKPMKKLTRRLTRKAMKGFSTNATRSYLRNGQTKNHLFQTE